MSNLWPKNMRWSDDKSQPKWIRPIRNILAIFDNEIIDFTFLNIKSSNNSLGHKTLSKKLIKIKNIADFQKKLHDNNVIFDQSKRKEIICNKISEICKKHKLSTIDNLENGTLLQDVIGLVEFPDVSIAKIDQQFMSLPREVLVLTAKNHQKYFCLQDSKGNLAPYFIFVSNVKVNKKIITDNEKVLTARLSDAKFFIEEDLKNKFDR